MAGPVVLSAASYSACLAHALSTERQEVMGLLLGEWCDGETLVAQPMPLVRNDKRADRVEVAYEELAEASSLAEEMGVRIVGWYHSHPHITVLPSHVDVQTQGQYQAMDPRFVGVIFAVYGQPGQVLVHAFRSVYIPDDGGSGGGTWQRTAVPVRVEQAGRREVPFSDALQGMINLQDIALAEERALAVRTVRSFSTPQHKYGNDKNNDYQNRNPSLALATYCSAVYSKALAELVDCASLPALFVLQSIRASLQAQNARLRARLRNARSRKGLRQQQEASLLDFLDETDQQSGQKGEGKREEAKSTSALSGATAAEESARDEQLKRLAGFAALRRAALRRFAEGVHMKVVSCRVKDAAAQTAAVTENSPLDRFTPDSEWTGRVSREAGHWQVSFTPKPPRSASSSSSNGSIDTSACATFAVCDIRNCSAAVGAGNGATGRTVALLLAASHAAPKFLSSPRTALEPYLGAGVACSSRASFSSGGVHAVLEVMVEDEDQRRIVEHVRVAMFPLRYEPIDGGFAARLHTRQTSGLTAEEVAHRLRGMHTMTNPAPIGGIDVAAPAAADIASVGGGQPDLGVKGRGDASTDPFASLGVQMLLPTSTGGPNVDAHSS